MRTIDEIVEFLGLTDTYIEDPVSNIHIYNDLHFKMTNLTPEEVEVLGLAMYEKSIKAYYLFFQGLSSTQSTTLNKNTQFRTMNSTLSEAYVPSGLKQLDNEMHEASRRSKVQNSGIYNSSLLDGFWYDPIGNKEKYFAVRRIMAYMSEEEFLKLAKNHNTPMQYLIIHRGAFRHGVDKDISGMYNTMMAEIKDFNLGNSPNSLAEKYKIESKLNDEYGFLKS